MLRLCKLYRGAADARSGVRNQRATCFGDSTKIADESKQIQAIIGSSGEPFDLKPRDWEMYSAKVRKAKYTLDDRELKSYFELNKVL